MGSVALENVVKDFRSKSGRVRALNRVSLHVNDGEFLTLVGPSGCGKTTTLRLIAGLELPDEGVIRVAGRVVNDVPPRDRDVAMVFQNYALYPHMTVYKNMAFGLKMRGAPRSEIDDKVRETAELLGLTPLLDRRPDALSGGQQQRVALGRAIVRKPQAFLLDEPLANLDATLRVQLRTELKALHQRLGVTVIHVTHDQEEAMILGDRLAVMRDGIVMQYGPPLEVYRRPANRFVATFIGRPAMNMLRGRLATVDGASVFLAKGGVRLQVPQESVSAMKADVNEDVILGVRAEHVRLAGAGSGAHDHPAAIPVTVTLVEPMGDRTYVHTETAGGVSWVARADALEAPRPGEKLLFSIDTRNIHWFATSEDGRRLEGNDLHEGVAAERLQRA